MKSDLCEGYTSTTGHGDRTWTPTSHHASESAGIVVEHVCALSCTPRRVQVSTSKLSHLVVVRLVIDYVQPKMFVHLRTKTIKP
jgi:hypothetical protein